MSLSARLIRVHFTKLTQIPTLTHIRKSTTLCAAAAHSPPPTTAATSTLAALAQQDQARDHERSRASPRSIRKALRLQKTKKKPHAPQAALASDKMNRGGSHPTRPNPDAPWERRQQQKQQKQQKRQKQQPQPTTHSARHDTIVATPTPSSQPQPPTRTATNPPARNKVEEQSRRNAPSEASGGIPDPTPAYLQCAASQPRTLPHPRKLLVVIDLNGTLLHRPNKRHPSRFVERPHARDFLAYCIDVFRVVIWSSAKRFNVASMANQLLTAEQRSRVVAIWARDKFGLTPEDFDSHTQCYKRLHVLWDDPVVAASHPDAAEKGAGGKNKRWSQADTVLIDDSLEKGRSEPHNLIEIPEFTSDNPEVADILPQVHDYINACASQENVSSFMRVTPFKAMPTSQLPQGTAQGLEG